MIWKFGKNFFCPKVTQFNLYLIQNWTLILNIQQFLNIPSRSKVKDDFLFQEWTIFSKVRGHDMKMDVTQKLLRILGKLFLFLFSSLVLKHHYLFQNPEFGFFSKYENFQRLSPMVLQDLEKYFFPQIHPLEHLFNMELNTIPRHWKVREDYLQEWTFLFQVRGHDKNMDATQNNGDIQEIHF